MAEDKEFADETKYGQDSSSVQCTNPWNLSVDTKGVDCDKYKSEHKIETVAPLITSLDSEQTPQDQLNNLKYILADILAGDQDAIKRPEFTNLNFAAMKSAIEWLAKTDQLSNMSKVDLFENGWRLNFKCKPPTAEEFLTEKYIGPMADSLYVPVKKAFIDQFDPLKPYRTTVLSMHIGWGKDQPLDAKVYNTPDSYTLMGDIKVGDKVLSPDGTQTEVVKTADWPEDEVYELEMDNGKKMRCGPHHMNHVSYRKDADGNKIWEDVETLFLINHPELEFEFQSLN